MKATEFSSSQIAKPHTQDHERINTVSVTPQGIEFYTNEIEGIVTFCFFLLG